MRSAAEVEVAKMKVTTEDLCKKNVVAGKREASDVLAQARAEAQKLTSEADERYRTMIADAEERSRTLLADTDEKVRKMIFEAENKAALAKGIFEDQVKKAAVHRQHMMSILEGQMELLKNFSEDTEK